MVLVHCLFVIICHKTQLKTRRMRHLMFIVMLMYFARLKKYIQYTVCHLDTKKMDYCTVDSFSQPGSPVNLYL